MNRRLDGSYSAGCSQGGRGLQAGPRPEHPDWLGSRALTLAILSRAGGLCSEPCPLPRQRRPHEEPSLPWPFYCPGQALGGRGLALRAASGLEDQVVWLIRKRVCMCVCVHVCVCSWDLPAPVSAQGWWWWWACPVSVPLCSRTSCVPPEHGSQAPPSLATPFPLRGPLHFTLGLRLASPLPTFPGAPLWKEGRLWPRACGSLMRLGVRGCGGQPAQGRTLCFKDRKPNLLTQGSLGDRRDLVFPSLRLGVFPLWPSTQPGANPAQGCSGLSCCLLQQVSQPGPL